MFAAEGVDLPDWVQAALVPEPTAELELPSEEPAQDPTDDLVVSTSPTTTDFPTPVITTQGSVTEEPAHGEDDVMVVETEAQVEPTTPTSPSIEQQANVFVQMVTTQQTPEAPLGFVNASEVNLATEAETIIVLDEPQHTVTPTTSSSLAVAV